MTEIYVDTCLNNICEIKFKSQLNATVHKQLTVLKKFCIYNSEPFSNCLNSVSAKISSALQQMEQTETLKGAIGLCDIFFSVLDDMMFE